MKWTRNENGHGEEKVGSVMGLWTLSANAFLAALGLFLEEAEVDLRRLRG